MSQINERLRSPCDEYCPANGFSCGLPEPSEIKAGLSKGMAWMCHSNPRVHCCMTEHYASEMQIDLEDPILIQVEESESLLLFANP